MRTQSLDTSPAFEQVYISRIRTFSPARKFQSVRSWTQSITSANLSSTPDSSDEGSEPERAAHFLAREYGGEMATLFRHHIEQQRDWTFEMPDLELALLPLLDSFDHLGVRFVLVGSLACSIYGLPRAVPDVDVLADVHQEQLPGLCQHLSAHYLIDPDAVARAIQQQTFFSVLHVSRLIKVDILLPSTSFDFSLLQRRQAMTVVEGRAPLWMARAEDLTVMLLRWYQQRGDNRDDYWNDLLGLLKVQAPTLDLPSLCQQAQTLQVSELCTQALIDAGIWGQESS